MKAKLILTGIALTALTAIAFTQQPGSGQGQRNGTGKGTAYVDANKNGICDNYENKTANCARHRKNGHCLQGGIRAACRAGMWSACRTGIRTKPGQWPGQGQELCGCG